jgi:hypothetical protein
MASSLIDADETDLEALALQKPVFRVYSASRAATPAPPDEYIALEVEHADGTADASLGDFSNRK